MTEQPPSAEAMQIAERIGRWDCTDDSGARAIDALIAQRVAATVHRICPNALHVGTYHASCDYPDCRDDSQCEFWKRVDGVETPAERPAPPRLTAEQKEDLRESIGDPRPAPESPHLSSEAWAYLAGLGGYGPTDVEEAARLYPMPVERPAPSALASTGEQPDFARCLRCVSHELTRDVCGYAGRCVRQATASPPPTAAVGYRSVTAGGIVGCWEDKWEIDAGKVPEGALDDLELEVRRALSAVASERDAAAMRAFAKRVWSDTEEVAYQAGVSDMRARLREPDEELIVAAQRVHCNPGRPPNNPCTFPDCGHCAPESREAMRAALTKIAEMLQ